MKKELALIIPVYNEQEIIETVLNDWASELERLAINYEIHAYNDGSKDNSLAMMKKAAEGNSKIFVHDKANSGHGSTILKGYRENSDAEWIFQIDSDNEFSAKDFHKFWEIRDNFDYIIGIRDHSIRAGIRQLISFVTRTSIRIFYGSGVYDINIPYRLMRVSKFAEFFKRIPADTFAPNVIISGLACKSKCRIKQMPVEFTTRQTGEVSIKKFKLMKVAAKSFWQTISFRFTI